MTVLDSLPWFSLDEKSAWAFIWRFWSRIHFQANSGDCKTKAPIFFLGVGKEPFSLLLSFMVSCVFKPGKKLTKSFKCFRSDFLLMALPDFHFRI